VKTTKSKNNSCDLQEKSGFPQRIDNFLIATKFDSLWAKLEVVNLWYPTCRVKLFTVNVWHMTCCICESLRHVSDFRIEMVVFQKSNVFTFVNQWCIKKDWLQQLCQSDSGSAVLRETFTHTHPQKNWLETNYNFFTSF